MRTTFELKNGKPWQRVHPKTKLHWDEFDASDWSPEQFQSVVDEAADQPFDLQTGPLFRMRIYDFGGGKFAVQMILHHIVADFWSMAILINDLLWSYLQEAEGVPTPLTVLKTEYASAMRKNRERIDGPEGERLWDHWKERLQGPLPQVDWPTDRPRPPQQTFQGRTVKAFFSEMLSDQLRQFCKTSGATPYTVCLAAFQALLHRYTGQEDQAVGTPLACRDGADLEPVVGYFSNLAVLRGNVCGETSFEALVEQAKSQVADAVRGQDFPFPLLVERMQPPRDPSRSPLVQTVFAWEKFQSLQLPTGTGGGNENPIQAVHVEQRGAPFDLLFEVFETDGPYELHLIHNVDLFDEATMQRMAEHYQCLLQDALRDPQQTLSQLQLLPFKEQRLLESWNQTERDPPCCLHEQ